MANYKFVLSCTLSAHDLGGRENFLVKVHHLGGGWGLLEKQLKRDPFPSRSEKMLIKDPEDALLSC